MNPIIILFKATLYTFHTHYSFKLIQLLCCRVVPHDVNYRGDHAVVLFPGTTAAEEGDEENHHADSDEDNGSS